jgi:hypothetical protein
VGGANLCLRRKRPGFVLITKSIVDCGQKEILPNRAMDRPGVGHATRNESVISNISVAKSAPGQLPIRRFESPLRPQIPLTFGLRIAQVTGRRPSMFAERVPESPRLARLLRYALRHFTFGRCFYTVLVVLLITTATVFLHLIDLWSAVPILIVASAMMVAFLLGFIAGNVPLQRASRLQALPRPSAK